MKKKDSTMITKLMIPQLPFQAEIHAKDSAKDFRIYLAGLGVTKERFRKTVAWFNGIANLLHVGADDKEGMKKLVSYIKAVFRRNKVLSEDDLYRILQLEYAMFRMENLPCDGDAFDTWAWTAYKRNGQRERDLCVMMFALNGWTPAIPTLLKYFDRDAWIVAHPKATRKQRIGTETLD